MLNWEITLWDREHNKDVPANAKYYQQKMEIRTLSPDDVKDVATTAARSIPIDEIDATFRSKYTGMHNG